MTPEHPHNLEREERVNEVLAEYLEAVEDGQAPDRQELLARHPDLAPELAAFLDDRDRVARLAMPFRSAVQAVLAATPPPVNTPFPGLEENAEAGPLPEREAHAFGDYELLAVLGQGGMGTVYKARQKGLNRLVALKMIRLSSLGWETEVQRFRNEAEMVALLDHPQIVPVYEVGQVEGQPYFCMKLIDGGSLAGHLARFRDDPRAAAQLVALIARAVHHAHQRGILHRDLKPSNILLDAAGQPYVTDFGLAKRLEADASLTQSGALVGTPSYMAPEQASGKNGLITTATDVYGLGAVLYALLTGKPPFHGETVLDTLERVKGCEPEPPTGHNRQVDRDLEIICLKCLEKDPQRRYGSAAELADDLERWLAGEPIRARPVGRASHLWRWCRRNPVPSGLVATTTLLVVLGVVGLAVGARLVWREKEQTREALAEARTNYAVAEAQRRRAETNFRQAYWTIEALLCAFDPDRSSRPVSVTELKQWQTERALRFLAPLREDPSEEPAARLQKGVAHVHAGRVYQVLREREKAQKAFRQAIAVFERLVQDFPDDSTYPRELGSALHILAEDLYQAGDVRDANAYYSRAVSVFREVTKNHPTDWDAACNLATSLCLWFDPELRDPTSALGAARKAVEMAPHDPDSWIVLGVAYYRTGQWDAAVRAIQEAARREGGRGKLDPTITSCFLAMAQWQCGRQEEAMKAYQQAVLNMENSFYARDSWDRAIRTEAATLLGVQESATPKVKEEDSRNE
jgi:tetratricopeptide (TPR) repeat protein/tRNA A-37 threonylcarbamoyl transferase component Bud32